MCNRNICCGGIFKACFSAVFNRFLSLMTFGFGNDGSCLSSWPGLMASIVWLLFCTELALRLSQIVFGFGFWGFREVLLGFSPIFRCRHLGFDSNTAKSHNEPGQLSGRSNTCRLSGGFSIFFVSVGSFVQMGRTCWELRLLTSIYDM